MLSESAPAAHVQDMPAAPRFPATIVTPPGIEQVTAKELEALRILPAAIEPGIVNASVTMREMYRANLHLRTASRILMPLANFRATSFAELERRAARVDWGRIVAPGQPVDIRVTCRKSRLYHSDAVAERLFRSLAQSVPGAAVAASGGEEDEGRSAGEPASEPSSEGAQLFVVRVFHDIVTVSADTSGALLHRRGYRLATAKAPIRENLAAAMLLGAGWDGAVPLADPMCGAGTIAIEAALIARRMPPGIHREFACQRWPAAPVAAFAAERRLALAQVLQRARVPIVASDRDAGAVAAACANATRAGVAADVEISQRALSALEPPAGPGLLIANPPYGQRVGDGAELRNLYAQLGNVARAKCAGWTLAFVSADRSLERQVKLPLEEVLKFRNGGIAVRLVSASVPSRG